MGWLFGSTGQGGGGYVGLSVGEMPVTGNDHGPKLEDLRIDDDTVLMRHGIRLALS